MRRGDALDDFREALDLASDPTTQARAAVALATALLFSNRALEAAELANEVGPRLGPEQREEAMRLDLLALVSAPGPVSLNRWGEEVLEGRTAAAKTVLGQLVFRRAVAGDPTSVVVPLARRALEGGRLPLGPESDPVFAPAHVLVFADLFDEVATMLDAVMAEAKRHGSLLWFAGSSALRSRVHYRTGALAEAEADARQALDSSKAGWNFWALEASHMLALVLAETGAIEEATRIVQEAAADVGPDALAYQHGFLSHAHGIVAAAAGRSEEAARAFLACGERMDELDSGNPSVLDWRSQAALAFLRVGDREQARRLAAQEVAEAQRFGAARAIGIALRVNALAQDPVSLAQLEEAVRVLSTSPARLEHARVLVDYGAAMRRTGRRAAARDPLLEGQDLAARCGAAPLVGKAREELLAAGARPRGVLRRGVDALTASERRVAAMAAEGLSNPDIAQALFVTSRTVEAHLSHTYQKLGISSRRELARALTPAELAP
jgi:ATP/maltotriose-dependent transcriptional regulator MalT